MCESKIQPAEPARQSKPLKQKLEDNKIYFETVAAVLLSIMAILVSIFQTITGCQQTKLARQQWRFEQQRAAVQKTADWQRLRDSVWELLDLYPKTGTTTLNNLDPKSKALWFSKVRSILDSQTRNPVLIENRVCLGCWRNAISSAKTSKDLLETVDLSSQPDWCTVKANSIMKDVLYVWEQLVLNSKEVSPTGGRPKEAEK